MLSFRAVNIFFPVYWMLIGCIVYITSGFKTIQVKWIFALAFRIPNIQTLSCNSPEPMVNRARFDSVQSISFEISAVIKQNHPLTSTIKCFSIIQRLIMILNQSNQLFYIKVLYFKIKKGSSCYRRGGVKVYRSPRMREIGVRSPVATDLSCKNR